MIPTQMSCRIQCQRISMCLVRLWNCGFLAIAKEDSLSPRISVGVSWSKRLSSVYKLRSQQASRAASVSVTYSALADDNACEICRLEFQVIAPFLAI